MVDVGKGFSRHVSPAWPSHQLIEGEDIFALKTGSSVMDFETNQKSFAITLLSKTDRQTK